MEKIRAKLVGIYNLAFDTEKEAEAFEERNLELITGHMKTLAEELDICPESCLVMCWIIGLNCKATTAMQDFMRQMLNIHNLIAIY